ncbi:LytTR family transcriptional regulator DNA-binding domain-containing protein [Paenibacillus sp. CF384]|uniref:LytTR family transcriptional regulator DNA-binding domain-containing protein n=1 Tax=Paenibacillus sp. CF384 TaxID=1884382 RepID=UPI00089B3708|nr:LytTr DNA-binding domain-containing protein [Paenibacillus sp. CF384]
MHRPFHVVNRRKDGSFDIVEIDLNDVRFVGSLNGEKYLQTHEGAFYYIKSPEEQERFFSLQGFVKIDRCFMVQKDKIEFYDEDTHQVFFEKEPVGKDALRAPVSRAHYKEVRDIRRRGSSTAKNGLLSNRNPLTE